MSYNSSHFRTSSINISPNLWRQKQAALVSKHSKRSRGDVRLFTLSETSQYRQVLTRSVAANILARQRRRNGTETQRRRSCQCEHFRLITHERILLNGDVPRQNGNATYSVNRPLLFLIQMLYVGIVFCDFLYHLVHYGGGDANCNATSPSEAGRVDITFFNSICVQ